MGIPLERDDATLKILLVTDGNASNRKIASHSLTSDRTQCFINHASELTNFQLTDLL